MERCNSERSGYNWHGDCCASDELCCDVTAESVHIQWEVLSRLLSFKVCRHHTMVGICGLKLKGNPYMAGDPNTL